MESKYQVGQQLELEVLSLQYNSIGDRFFCVTDGETEYRIFNILKCQEEGELPTRLYVKVKSVDAFGHVRMVQDTQRVFADHYIKDQNYAFSIDEIKLDKNNNPFYAISDDFSDQRFYFHHDEQKYGVGDIIILKSQGMNAKGFVEYKIVESATLDAIPKEEKPTAQPSIIRTNTVNYGPESATVEYKSSLVYTAKGECNIEKQSRLIVTEIAAMMNTEGGKLVIGIKDDQTVCGVEGDFDHLNEDETDTFTYKQDEDGFKQKILHQLNYLCSMLAGMSIKKIEFKEKMDKRYCVIDIDKAERPVWVGGTRETPALYIRQDCRLKQLRGDEITEFIYRRMKKATEDVVGGAQALAALDETTINEIVRRIINANKKEVILPPMPKREIDWWIVWKNDGVWYRQREQSTEADVAIQVPLYKNMSTPIVLFCYDNTNIVARDYRQMNRGSKVGQPNTSVWTPGMTPRNIFIVEPTDYLCIHSLDYHGAEYVKMHAVTDFNTVASPSAAGNPILPTGSKILQYGIIGAENKAKLNELIVPKARRSQDKGALVNTQEPRLADEVAQALALIKR